MKTSPLDFLLAALTLGVALALALGATVFGVVPLTTASLHGYHTIADAAALFLLFGIACGIQTRVLIRLRPLKAGDYPMDHPHFTYWKLYTVLYEMGRGALLPYTTVFSKPLVEKLFGARIGAGVAMGGRLADPQLVSVGLGAVLGHQSVITPHAITSGHIMLRPVTVGARATVGVNVVIMPGVEIGEDAVVTAGSVVLMHTKIPARELWGGTPAGKIKDITPADVRA